MRMTGIFQEMGVREYFFGMRGFRRCPGVRDCAGGSVTSVISNEWASVGGNDGVDAL